MPRPPFKPDSSTIQTHLGIIQVALQRMSANSSSSKAWCITVVSAVLVLIADKGNPQYSWIALVPTVLFFALDAYYLGLERGFRLSYDEFLAKLAARSVQPMDLYWAKPQGNRLIQTLQAIGSFSIWPFYATLLGMILAARYVIIAKGGA